MGKYTIVLCPQSHPAQEPPGPSTSALQRAPVCLAHMDSPVKESEVEELDLPSMHDTFDAARDLIAMVAQQSPASVERVPDLKPLAPHIVVLSRGKSTMIWH